MKFRRSSSQPNIILLEGDMTTVFEDTVAHSAEKPWWHRAIAQLSSSKMWSHLLAFFSGSSEPIVKQMSDRHGQTYFIGYDPISGIWTGPMSEGEIRIWLEQRYYINS